jgi:16S rRNA (adenine1518-N6/adenine1519-N6)-dimethyltransferase
MTHSRPMIRELLNDHGLAPRRDLGQNFVTDPNTVRRIAALARVGPGDHVVEVGAGLGSLTLALAETKASITAVEIDRGVVPVLRAIIDESGVDNVSVVEANAMETDWDELLDASVPGGWTLVANLPYNVGTGIVLDALTGSPKVESCVVMVQREVADRMLAHPGSRTYGLPSVVVGLHAKGTIAFSVPPEVFDPQPRVESAVILLDRIEPDRYAHRALEVAAGAFGQRRKMLRRSLASVLSDPVTTMAAAGIDPTLRAEDLAPDEFVAIARAEMSS